MLTQSSEYALRIVVFLGTLAGQPATNRQIAAATKVPAGYLAKLLQTLARAGIVRSQRGLHGGSALARPASDISILEVVNAVSPLPRIRTCPLGLPSHGENLCPMHRRLDDALAQVEKVFRETTVAELLSTPTRSQPLGDLPAAAMATPEDIFRVTPPSPPSSSPTPLTLHSKRIPKRPTA